ncbi:HAD family hydrolase [Streptomyces indicus]|uniref:Haloacid dehalogenase superfamily, subfamily IA, variant 3 with third motif having DD or ED n=1 Tax=Streptomyces indicus TaxID=417292 RepID=A0A1G9DXS0_9ACTN|nr:HAD family phosphatase [Streptomyces indicus]SDK68691.1 haloacid dehalogenase superfamily, subfamily IA, variant 3 with third motif having DD or ED [Streptomyces indicus]
MPTLPIPAALLCDMDGTLVDTEHAWLDVVREFLAAEGRLASASVLAPFAGATIAAAADLLVRDQLTARSREETARALDKAFTEAVAADLRVQPGALALLDRVRELGVPTALVTSSERHVADVVLSALGRHRFDVSFAEGESERGKPHPDPYLNAASALDVAPSACLAVEDTPTGAAAALSAGCALLAVPSVPGITPGPRTTIVSSLTEVAF